MRCRNCRYIAGEVKVYIPHGVDLCVSSAGSSSFDTECRRSIEGTLARTHLRYQEELEKYEKKYATFEETYTESFKRIKEKREAELKDLMDSCINRPEDFPLFDEDEEEIDEDSSPE